MKNITFLGVIFLAFIGGIVLSLVFRPVTNECPAYECRESFLYEKLIECREQECPKYDAVSECMNIIDQAKFLEDYNDR